FPKDKDTANVGIGIDARDEKTAKYYLDRWMREHDDEYGFSDASIIEVRGGGIPVGGFLKKMTMDGLIVIGDAAHQVHPLHGGGMALAMEAAATAAEVAAKAHEKNDFTDATLDEYNKKWWGIRGGELENTLKMRYAFERLDDGDFNYFAELLSDEDILAISRGDVDRIKDIALRALKERPKLALKFREFIGDAVKGLLG
ncbi:MAG: NAD(P)/FAD-dependent oxidoreductase, partial [Candidatus Diapherotrites archaeon]|nr:NAD(P)/FAD-dependent oxidoreductase [Candidatus Diapherotrites archaeon]